VISHYVESLESSEIEFRLIKAQNEQIQQNIGIFKIMCREGEEGVENGDR
jgi:hypothetical protein